MTDVWTRIQKPTESSVTTTTFDAQPWGMLIAITSIVGIDSSSVTSGWNNVSKPTSSVWTLVAKPTQ